MTRIFDCFHNFYIFLIFKKIKYFQFLLFDFSLFFRLSMADIKMFLDNKSNDFNFIKLLFVLFVRKMK